MGAVVPAGTYMVFMCNQCGAQRAEPLRAVADPAPTTQDTLLARLRMRHEQGEPPPYMHY